MTTTPTATTSLLALLRDGFAIVSLLYLLPALFAVFTSDKTPRSFATQMRAGCALIVLILCFLDNSKGLFPNRWPALLIMLFVIAILIGAHYLRKALTR